MATATPTTTGETAAVAPTDRRILAAFEGTIERPRTSLAYKAGLLAAAAGMVLLPLAYLALVGGIAWATWWHVVNDVPESAIGYRTSKLAAVFYVLPIFAGGVTVLFLLKPFFAKKGAGARPHVVTRKSEPLLFTYVDRIADLVGAPRPVRIELDCDVNASAGFDGLRGFLSNELVLTIGLPLVAGMDLRQLTGVLAHELGHFGQAAGMRLTVVVRGTNAWLARVAHARDAWDAWLANADPGGWGTVAIALARALVWASRQVLAGFAWAGHVVSSFMMRQMEFDADRYEARMAGAAQFADTSRRLRLLGAASAAAHARLGELWRGRKLADDLPELVAGHARAASPDLLRRLDQQAASSRTGWLDTHPCDRERIERARREGTDGIFRLEVPAAVLFRDLPRACREASLSYYRERLGPDVQASQLVATQGVVDQAREEGRRRASALRWFQGVLTPTRPVALEGPLPPPDPAALMAARRAVDEAARAARAAMTRWERAQALRVDAARADALLAAGVDPSKHGLALPRPGHDGVAALRDRAAQWERESDPVLAAFEEHQRVRLLTALALLRHPQMPQRLPAAARLADRCEAWRSELAALAPARPAAATLLSDQVALAALMQAWPSSDDAREAHLRRVVSQSRVTSASLGELRSRLRVPDPRAEGETMTIAERVVPQPPDRDAPADVLHVAEAARAAAQRAHFALLARLTEAGEQVEACLGLPRQDDPAAAS